MSEDPRFVQFVRHFNGDRDYFECHELLEELWMEEGRHPLLQGLLQAAVALYHWRNGNVSGAAKLMRLALGKLEGWPDRVLGLELGVLRGDLDRSLAILQGAPESVPFEPFLLKVADSKLAARVQEPQD